MSTAVSFVPGRETFVMIAEGHDFGVVDEPVDHGRGFDSVQLDIDAEKTKLSAGGSACPVA